MPTLLSVMAQQVVIMTICCTGDDEVGIMTILSFHWAKEWDDFGHWGNYGNPFFYINSIDAAEDAT